MKRITYIFVAALFATLFVSQAVAQRTDEPPQERANMMRQLGLSRQQMQTLRRINAERRPLIEAAQDRFRFAMKQLDEAIYADTVNETDVQDRLKELQLAQAEVFRLRFMNELAIRKMLTPEQLVRFRQMRQRFERARQGDRTAVVPSPAVGGASMRQIAGRP